MPGPQPAPTTTRVLKDEPGTRVVLTIDGGEARVTKTYRNRGLALLQTFARRSRAAREHDNLRAVAALDLPCTPALAWSERRRWGLVAESTLVTRYLPDTVPLKQTLADLPRDRAFATRRRLVTAMARLVAALHRGGILWATAMPRNVLVVGDPTAARLAICDVPTALHAGRPLHGTALARIDLFDAAFSPSRRSDFSATERWRWLLGYCDGDRVRATGLWRRLARRGRLGQDLHRALARLFLLYLGRRPGDRGAARTAGGEAP